MNSSYHTDISVQTSQPGSTRSTWAPSNFVPSPVDRDCLRSPPAQLQGTLRPPSFLELIDRTEHHWLSLKNDSKPLKGWLRLAENIRRDAKSFHKQGDLESALVEYAKAATIVHEKIPAHPDYWVLLSTRHRNNMGQHGQQLLDSLAEIKISIMTRYDQWQANPSSTQPQAPASHPVPQPSINSHGTNTPDSSSTPSNSRSRASIPLRSRSPSPYEQSPTEDDRAPCGRVDALLREDVCPADGARADQCRLEQDGIIRRQREATLPLRYRAVALPSEDTLGVVKGSLSRYRHSKAGHDGEGEGEEVPHAARTAGGHNEPISEPETPKQRPVALHAAKTPAQRSNMSHESMLPSVNHTNGLVLPTDTSMEFEAAANPTPEVFEGFDMLYRPPESQLHDKQPEYLRILQDKFGTPRPDRGHRYSFTNDSSICNEGDEDYQKSFVDPDNESCDGRCSVKTVSKESLFSLDDLHRHGLSPKLPRNRTPIEGPYDTPSPSLSPSLPQRSRSQSRPRLESPAPEPAHSRPYNPHDGSTPSIIQPIPIPTSASPLHPSPSPSPVRHPSVRIPPDNWIPRAQDAASDGRLSIILPPQQIGEIASNNSPASTHLSESDILAPVGQKPSNTGPPPAEEDELEYIDAPTERIPRQPIASDPPLQRRQPQFAMRPSRGSPRPRNIVSSAPLSQAPAQSAVPSQPPYLQQQPPPPRAHMQDKDNEDAPVHVTGKSNRPKRSHSRSSISIFVEPPSRSNSPSSDNETLRRLDPPTERLPRQPIAPDPPVQRRQPQMGPSRDPSRPRNIVSPAPLSQASAQPAVTSLPPYLQQQPPPPQAHVQDEDDEDAPVHMTAKSNRPKRSHSRSSISIFVEPPSRSNSPSSDNEALRRLDPPTERIPRQPIAPDPPVQRRPQVTMGPSRDPSRPRNIVSPAPLSQASAQPAVPSQPPYLQQQPPPPRAHMQDKDNEDAPVHVTGKSKRPKRSHSRSSISIFVEPPSRSNSPSSDNEALRRLDPPTERLPRQPIAPDPPVQRRQPQVTIRPSRGPSRPRNIVTPAPLSQASAQPAVPSQPPYLQQQPPPPQAHVQDKDNEDGPVHVARKSKRPKRSRSRSSISIFVEPPSPSQQSLPAPPVLVPIPLPLCQ